MMSRWSRIAVIIVIIMHLLCCVHFLNLKGLNTRYDSNKLGSNESPSLFAPLVITMCESLDAALEEGENMTDIISKADNSSDAAFKLRGSWIRQRDQVATLLKTLLLFSKSPVWRIVVLTDNHATFDKILKIADGFPSRERGRLLLERRDQWYPPAHPELRDDWRPCAWAKQFLAEALPDEDAVVYVDTDVVFLGPAETMWSLFGSLEPQELIALSVEPQYLFDKPKRFHAGSIGLNTGVMMTNLTRQRQLPGGSLGSAMIQAGLLNTRYLYRHDQDALNHYLKKKPHLFLEVSPRWNFIVGACNREAPYCVECVTYGIVVLHGADATFYRPIDRKFLAIYDSLLRMSLNEDPRRLLAKIKRKLEMLDYLHVKDFICHDYALFNHAVTASLSRLVSTLPYQYESGSPASDRQTAHSILTRISASQL